MWTPTRTAANGSSWTALPTRPSWRSAADGMKRADCPRKTTAACERSEYVLEAAWSRSAFVPSRPPAKLRHSCLTCLGSASADDEGDSVRSDHLSISRHDL